MRSLPIDRLQYAVEAVSGELVEAVERQKLQSVARIQLGGRNEGVCGLDGSGRAPVAVVERCAQHPLAPQEGVVNRPRARSSAGRRLSVTDRLKRFNIVCSTPFATG